MFVRRLADLLALSEARYDGLVTQIRRRAGPGIHAVDGATAARSLTARALILHDPSDRQVPFSHGEALARAWSGALLQATPGLGHRRLLYDGQTVARTAEHLTRDERQR
jgi:pimeloyl-ACP methyl ester carboxylesterase